MDQAMAQLACFPSYLTELPTRHAQWITISSHGAQLWLMIMMYMSVDRVNGVIVIQNVLVMVLTAL